ncbi:MAG TPA: response regulator [Steroidobacteraceae bacterium]|jgi:CheY-like chemotaxis protein|nr:response regulator [Steroidobacteraceae bacterium]
MGAKRALIVDDSKSARVFLARVLENYDIDVDSAESAEAAIEYLISNRPDVIFMDHLMPGMDGFQAVQAIKNDPRTATIPIMMYTSQEGELYLGQARALGAVGVLPKQIKPTDVSKVLYQLHLVADRRDPEQSTFTPLNLRAEGAPETAAGVGSRALTETTLREHFADLRRALVAGIDTQTDRISSEVRALLLESLPPATPTNPPTQAMRSWAWLPAAALLLIGLTGAVAWWRSAQLLEAVRTELSAQRAPQAAPLVAAAATDTADSAGSSAAAAAPAPRTARAAGPESRPIIVPVPYGADALGGARLEVIRRLLDRLSQQKATGVVDVRAFAGRFCLVGNAVDGFAVPPDEMPFAKCDAVGNPADEALSAAQRTPLALANLIASVRSATHGALQVQVSTGDADSLRAPYPTVAGDLTAGDWNRSGSANNRVEIRVP